MAYTYISGATGGIGKAFAIECAKLKYALFLTGRSEEKLSKLKEELLEIDGDLKIEYFPCDLTKEERRKEMMNYIDAKGLKFDRIINVAGVDTQMAFLDYSLDKVLFQLRVNTESTIAITYELLLRKAPQLEILTISSMSGVSPMPYFAIYSATKASLTSFFSALHYELKDKGVKVTTVLPGGVPTREDIKEDIKGQGLWGKLSVVMPDVLAKKSLKAVSKNKLKYIPGFFNKFLNFIMKLAPQKLKLRFIARRWKKIKKDAF